MPVPIMFILLLYINNGIIFYYGFSGLKGFLKNDYNNMAVPMVEHYNIFIIWFVVFLIYTIINIIYLKHNINKNQFDKIYKYTKIVKLSIIPFWIINIVAYFGVMQFFVLLMWGMAVLIVPIIVFISYLVLVSTSIYSISYIIVLKRNNKLTKKQFIINILFQLCFILDIIGLIYLLKLIKKNDEIRTNGI
jgi:hypothetical protein